MSGKNKGKGAQDKDIPSDISLAQIFESSAKAELLDALADELEKAEGNYKVVIVIIVGETEDDKDTYTSRVLTMGLDRTYEAYGILEVGKQHLLSVDW